MIHLDTSFLVHALAAGTFQDQRLREWLAAGETLGMSAVAWAEFLSGPVEPAALELLDKVVTERAAFGEGEAMLAARLFNESGRRRGSFADCMIAAAAIRAGVPLATDNPKDFRRFAAAGLTLTSGVGGPSAMQMTRSMSAPFSLTAWTIGACGTSPWTSSSWNAGV